MNNFKLNKKSPYHIAILPPRTQDIVKKRFGLENNKPKTLEAVGQDYNVTRERIRQIIEASLKTVKKQPVLKIADAFMKQAERILKQSNGIDENIRFLTKIDKEFKAPKGNLSVIRFLLSLNPNFSFEEENDLYNSFWHFSGISKDKIYKNIKEIECLFKKNINFS